MRFSSVAAVLLGGAMIFPALSVAPAAAQDLWCENADDIHAAAQDSTITVYHDAAVYNCCPAPFTYEMWQEGSLIHVREIEILIDPCYCVCCFDLRVAIEHAAPGNYVIDFSWFDYEGAAWRNRLVEVHVPDAGQQERPALGPSSSSGCLEAQAVPEPEWPPHLGPQSTWGRIKGLFAQ
jgi:hypothetical protein